MAKIDRNSIEDAKKVFEKLLPDESTRTKLIEFLSDAISYADILDSNNWNLNLDKNGAFIQFNTGHPYCIRIRKDEILILCDRTTLKPIIQDFEIPVKYRGYIGKERFESSDIDQVPDCLVKAKNSVGCLLPINIVGEFLHLFKSSNKDFIKKAIKSRQLRQMREAHSWGAVEYLAKNYSDNVSQPIYELTDLPTLNEFIEDEKSEIEKARKLNHKQRQTRLIKSDPKPKKMIVSQTVFIRNPYVVAEVLERANGKCERCNEKAPFLKDTDESPYLEVHHKMPLAEGGDDTVENAIGLCPNCHRHAHYGTKTY